MSTSGIMAPMDSKPVKVSRARSPSLTSDTSDDINFTGCENARKIFMALRGKSVSTGKDRDQVISISSSSAPKTTNTGELSSSGSSRKGGAIFTGRGSIPMAQATKDYRHDGNEEENIPLDLFPLDLHDEREASTSRPATGAYKPSKDNGSKGHSPSSRYETGFVQHGADRYERDPFGTPSSRSKNGSKDLSSCKKRSAFSTPSDKQIALRSSTNWRSGSSGSSCSEKISDKSLVIRSKENELSTPMHGSSTHGPKTPIVSSDNAQAIYPPSACVFVANLLQTEDELQLKVAVTQVFREFGVVFVKIRRDAKNMPFAFCQYTNDSDAAKAIQYGKGRLIHGRPCRTEKAKARRTFYISRRYSPGITEEEGRTFLEKFGEIERIWVPERHEIVQLDLDDGFFVQFTFFESGREALAACRDHDVYHLKPIDNKENAHYMSSIQRKRAEEQQLENWLDRYGQDTRSIFVGNLPQRFTESQLRDLFCSYGEIIQVTLFKNHSSRPGFEYNVFGFVEYESPAGAQRAISAKHGAMIDGEYLKVVQKNSDHKLAGARRRSTEVDHTPRHGAVNSQPVVTPVAPANMANPYPYGYPTPYTSAYPPFISPPYYPPYAPFWNGSPPGSSAAGPYYGYAYPDYYAQQAATQAYYPSPVPYNPQYPPQNVVAENTSDSRTAPATTEDHSAPEDHVPQAQ